MLNFSNTEPSINLEQIKLLEELSELKFPEEYKKHLISHNGGQCQPNRFKFIEDGKTTESSVDWFLAIYDGEYDNLRSYIEIYKMEKKRMPLHILPIAHDPGGNLICISCGGNDLGHVYFWNHEREVDYDLYSDDDYSNLYLISSNFTEFLNNLY